MQVYTTFTVLTPTYNRAHTLHRVFDSLMKQSFRDFEWLIVDDGSTDNTREIVESFMSNGQFDICYHRKPNGGKHTAINLGVRHAKGILTVIVDSDDWLLPDALVTLHDEWSRIADGEKSDYSGVIGLCQRPDGTIVGSSFPTDVYDSTPFEIRSKGKITGDKAGCKRTDILRAFPYPEFDGEKFMPDGIVWNRIGTRFRERYINHPISVRDYQKDGITANNILIRINSPSGSRLYYKEYFQLQRSYISALKQAVNYVRFSFHARCTIRELFDDIISRRNGLALAILPGYILYLRDRQEIHSHRNA